MDANYNTLILFNPLPSNRSGYVFRTLFEELLGLSIQETADVQFFASSTAPKLSYSASTTHHPLHFYADGFLIDGALPVTNWNDLNTPFFKDGDIPLKVESDIFSFVFFLLSRYEEYANFTPDKHGRFTANQSWAAQRDLLDKPLVNIIALKLKTLLLQHYPDLNIQTPHYTIQPTYDIDYAFSFKHKGWWRTFGASAKDLLSGCFAQLSLRWQVLLGLKPDPFFTFDYLDDCHTRLGFPAATDTLDPKSIQRRTPIYFWLLGDWGTYDKNISHHVPALQELIKRHQKRYFLGIHPSYASNNNKSQLETEIKRLTQVTNTRITRSRQHFLKLSLPYTYHQLCTNGIVADYSMGYAETTGFRAGIANNFWWYDLSTEQVTSLRIHPFALMDVTLQNYLALTPAAAIQRAESVMSAIREVGGTHCFIFHNNSLCESEDWQGWRQVYERLLEG